MRQEVLVFHVGLPRATRSGHPFWCNGGQYPATGALSKPRAGRRLPSSSRFADEPPCTRNAVDARLTSPSGGASNDTATSVITSETWNRSALVLASAQFPWRAAANGNATRA